METLEYQCRGFVSAREERWCDAEQGLDGRSRLSEGGEGW